MHHTQIKSTTERRIYNPRPIKQRYHPAVDNYSYSHIVHYVITQYSLRKGFKKFREVGEVAVEK